jgi:hypothetical protein
MKSQSERLKEIYWGWSQVKKVFSCLITYNELTDGQEKSRSFLIGLLPLLSEVATIIRLLNLPELEI